MNLNMIAIAAFLFGLVTPVFAQTKIVMKEQSVECGSAADCERTLAQQVDTCPTGSKLSASSFSGGVAVVVCVPVVPQIPPSVAGDTHQSNVSVKPVTSITGDYWVMGTNCSREPTLRLVRTTATGRTVYEAYCLATDERLSGASVTDGAKSWPAYHSSLGCVEIDTANGRTVDKWPSDARGARLDRSALVTFNAEVTVVSCGARKIFAKKNIPGKKNSRTYAARTGRR